MGLFSGIKKGFKKVFKGVKKAFKKVGKFAGKVMSSKWFKGLMIAAAVFTGGMALMAGFGNAMATSGTFMTKFVAGAKGFMSGLMNPVATGKGALAGAQGGGGLSGALQGAAQGSGALQTAGAAQTLQQAGAQGTMGQGPMSAAPPPDAGSQQAWLDKLGQGQGAAPPSGAMSPAAAAPAGAPAVAAPTTMPGKLMQGAKNLGGTAVDFAKSPGGGMMLMGAMQGYAAGKREEDYLKKGGYEDRQWADPRQRMLLSEASDNMRNMTSGYAERRAQYQSQPGKTYTGYTRDPRRGEG